MEAIQGSSLQNITLNTSLNANTSTSSGFSNLFKAVFLPLTIIANYSKTSQNFLSREISNLKETFSGGEVSLGALACLAMTCVAFTIDSYLMNR